MKKMIAANCKSAVLIRRRGRLVARVLIVAATMTCSVPADEKNQAKQARDEALAARRFELLRQRVAAARARSGEPGFPAKFAEKPILKYSDPARGYVSAGVWKLGEEGRPKALLAAELDRRDRGAPCLAFEYLSLTTIPFSLTSDDMRWSPSGTMFQFKPIPNTSAPEETPQRRLRQLREIARRFASHEEVKKERCELRLLSAPVDRYTPSNADRSDGAVFFFTYGTNPAVVLLFESDGSKWNFAVGRLTGAQVVELTFDGTIVWEGVPLEKIPDAAYTGSSTPIDIPGIAKDGSEAPE